MISSHFDSMVSALLPAGEFQLFRTQDLPLLPRASLDRFLSEAEAALREKSAAPALLDMLESPETAMQALSLRERALSALVTGEAITQRGKDGRYLRAAANLLYSLCGDASWNEPTKRAVAPKNASPDTRAAQIAELIAWTVLLIGTALNSLAPGLSARALEECEERVLRFLDDPAYCEAVLRRPDAVFAARALVSVCVIVPQEESARWLRLKNALRVADRIITGRYLEGAHAREGLASWLRGACAIADLVLLTDFACGGQSGLRADEDLREEMRLLSRTHISNDWFIDPVNAMKPDLAGEDVYRLGAVFDDDCLCALGAEMIAREAELTRPPFYGFDGIASRVLNALWRGSLEGENGKLSESQKEEAPSIGLYAARPIGGEGFYTALKGGSLILFLDGEPVLIDGPSTLARSLPVPDGKMPVRQSVRDAQTRLDGFPTITMDIAPSYPQEACLASWQRTVMLTGGGQVARLLDAFDFSGHRSGCSLRFITPHRPVIAVGAPRARIGKAYLEWDGGLEPSVETIEPPEGAKLWCGELSALVLTQRVQIAGGCWTAILTRAKE